MAGRRSRYYRYYNCEPQVLSQVCVCCKKEKNRGEFHVSSSCRNGIHKTCKECVKIRKAKSSTLASQVDTSLKTP